MDRKYALTVVIPIDDAVDDIDARQSGKVMLCKVSWKDIPGAKVKLQEIFDDKPPRKVEWRDEVE